MVRLLGPIEIEMDGATPASLYRPRKVALLSYLLLAGRPVRRLELAALLWPDAVEKRARGSLNQLLVELRRELGADAFVTRGDDALSLSSEHVWCDAVELERAAACGNHAEVVRLYRGGLLDGFGVSGLDELNDWIDRARRRLSDTVADSACRTGALRLASELRPYDEAVLRKRMSVAAAESGAAAAAVLYEAHRARLAEELGIAPSPETRKLLFDLCNAQVAGAAELPGRQDAADTPNAEEGVVAEALPGSVAALPVRRARRFTRLGSIAALAACIMLVATGVFGTRMLRQSTTEPSEPVNVVLMNFGDQSEPVIRALPGLVATYLIRDTSIDVAYNDEQVSGYHVVADLQSEKDELFGTVQIRNGDALVSSTTVRTSTSLGIDTIAAQLARYVSDVTGPGEKFNRPELAIGAARQHLLYARADYVRGVRQNASYELEKARLQLDTVSVTARDTEWNAVAEAVAREREWQRRGE